MKRPTTAPLEPATPAHFAWTATAILLGGGPHLPQVAPWITALLLAALTWRIAAAWRGWRLPGLWIRVPMTFFAFAAVMVSYRSVSGVEAGSALLLVMAAMKLLETRSVRDRILLTFIGYFLLFATFLREQALWAPLWLVAATLGITTALAQTVRSGPLPPPVVSMRLATRLLLQAAPVAFVLFILFPRVPGPFWALPKPGLAGTSGLSEAMVPGDITALSLSDEVAFRVRFTGPAPPASLLYWRGPVLDRFDGRRWQASRQPTPRSTGSPVHFGGTLVEYEVVLEPHGQRWIPALETPLQWSLPRAWLTGNRQLIAAEPVGERLSYRARSRVNEVAPAHSLPDEISRATYLPAGRNPRTRDFAAQMRAESTDERDYVERILQYFHSEPFWYKLDPPALGMESVDEFLFETREGFCEHYASAFATLARAGGIPARVVLGYQGAERNPLGDHWIVRQAHAHAWTEVWLDGRWRRVDPTAAVAPERIDHGIERTLARAPGYEGRLWRDNPALHRLVLSWDAVNAAWDRWVLAFGPEMQMSLLLALGFDAPRPAQLAALAVSATALCVLVLTLALRQSGVTRDPAQRLYAEFCRRLGAIVRRRAPAESPSGYARAVATVRPDLAVAVDDLTAKYLRLRYERPGDSALQVELARALRRFRPARAPAPGSAAMYP